jgi:ribosomal protein L11 methyltransferase
MQFDLKIYPVDADSVRENVLSIVATASAKITPPILGKLIFERYGLNKKQIKTVIRDLVFSGELTYTYEFGSTFLERSFGKPVRISRYVVLTPPDHSYRSKPKDVVVQIKPGASFGAGRHPSTRMAIKGIEYVLLGDQTIGKRQNSTVLDIGTGSGVLLITAILCGMNTGLGIDIDCCARVEAAENVRINGLEAQADISGQSLADIHQRFSIILANLRCPSLKKMVRQVNEIADSDGFLIFSGIKDNELDDLLKVYEKMRFKSVWTDNELGWAGVVLRRWN